MRAIKLDIVCLAFAAIALTAAIAGAAHAQDSILDASTEEAEPASHWSWFGDLQLRYDHVEGLPNDRIVNRWRGRGHLGGEFVAMPELSFGAAIELAQGSDDNADNVINNDNARSNHAAANQLWMRWQPSENTRVQLGKAAFPLELTPLTWDADLRPVGISLRQSIALGDYSRIQFDVGGFAPQHYFGDESRLAAAQLSWRWHEGAPTNAAVMLSYLNFSDLDELTRRGLTRTNRRLPQQGPLLSDYRLLDLLVVGRTALGDWPLEARLDLVRNLGADDQRDGARFSLVLGSRLLPRGWELGYSIQRIQRDAVLAAFNEDDWWFHSYVRGVMPWVGYGINERWNLRLALFHEQRGGLPRYTDRILFDIGARW
ncbi:MAG: hypothetical protein JNN30_10105 [Rhodanobacteraceae bacterium]|nr:hypothetical protein [Rhodanobacteraceae bacterium]